MRSEYTLVYGRQAVLLEAWRGGRGFTVSWWMWRRQRRIVDAAWEADKGTLGWRGGDVEVALRWRCGNVAVPLR